MLSVTSSILRHSSQLLSTAKTPATCLINAQQTRFSRKTFRFRFAYGRPPLVSAADYDEAEQNGQLEELKFENIRFASISETNSPLYDKTIESYIRTNMTNGRLDLFYELMHETLYKIKAIQYQRQRKIAEKGTKIVNDDGEEVKSLELNPVAIFHKALRNCEPLVITRKIKRGGAIYQVPFPLRSSQSEWFARKWLHQAVLERPKPRTTRYFDALAQEVLDAYEGRGKVIKRKDDIHRLADANKAYAHYRWG